MKITVKLVKIIRNVIKISKNIVKMVRKAQINYKNRKNC